MGSGVNMASNWSDRLRRLRSNPQLSTRRNLCTSGACRESKQVLEGGAGLMDEVWLVVIKREFIYKGSIDELVMILLFSSMEAKLSPCIIGLVIEFP